MESISFRLVVGLGVASMILAAPAFGQFPEVLSLGDLDGTNGFTVVGYLYDEFGSTVAGIGDVNADGIDDIATGGPGCAFPPPDFLEPCNPLTKTAGAVYVIFGRPDIGGDGSWNASDLDGTNGFRIEGIFLNSQAGDIAPAGDFNNDGIADFLVGAATASPSGVFAAGEAYMIYGRAGLGSAGSFDLTSLDGSNGFTIRGTNVFDGIGSVMSHIGDFNNDGISDVAIANGTADPGGRTNAGQTYVLFGGRSTGASGSFTVPNDVTPENGIKINGISAHDLTRATGSAGDFNGDGVPDLLFVSSINNPPGLADNRVYLLYGGFDAGETGVFELSDLDGTNGFIVNTAACQGPEATRIGGPKGVGDLNDDGCDDIAISIDIPFNNPGDWVAVIFGGSDVATNGVFCLDDFDGENGFKVLRAAGGVSTLGLPRAPGDLNHDGVADLFTWMRGGRLFYGGAGIGASGTVDIDDLDGLVGAQFWTGGRDRSYAGDVNHDGIQDLILGGTEYVDESDVGKIHVVFGRRMGDGDLDADVDVDDYAAFSACVGLLNDGDVPDTCHPFDFDRDNDVDLPDWGSLQSAFNTPP